MTRVLALDYGSVRCGCALSDPTGSIVTPIDPLAKPASRRGQREGGHRADARTRRASALARHGPAGRLRPRGNGGLPHRRRLAAGRPGGRRRCLLRRRLSLLGPPGRP